jgi:hypothetical protein
MCSDEVLLAQKSFLTVMLSYEIKKPQAKGGKKGNNNKKGNCKKRSCVVQTRLFEIINIIRIIIIMFQLFHDKGLLTKTANTFSQGGLVAYIPINNVTVKFRFFCHIVFANFDILVTCSGMEIMVMLLYDIAKVITWLAKDNT